MTDVFLLQNRDQRYLDKHGEWTDGGDLTSLYRTAHKDEALNQRLELTVRDPALRISIISCSLDEKGRPRLAQPAPASAPGGEEPSASEEPSAGEEPSASKEPSAEEEPSASKEPPAGRESSANTEPSAEPAAEPFPS